MWTAVIDSIHLTIVVKNGNGVSSAADYHAAALLDLTQRPNSKEIGNGHNLF